MKAGKEAKRAVVLLSGGVDSATTLAIAKAQGFENYALSFDYGQRHKIELDMAKLNAEKFSVRKHLVIDFNMRDIGGSALTSGIEVPKKNSSQESVVSNQGDEIKATLIPVTYVPARNTIFLSFALGWAEVLDAADIFIGANAVDYSGYPDCRPEFIRAFEDMANLATKASVEGEMKFRINTPLIMKTKAEIISTGLNLGVDYAMTWSCYDPQTIIPSRPPLEKGGWGDLKPCMLCDSCRIRAKGFREAGIKDPQNIK